MLYQLSYGPTEASFLWEFGALGKSATGLVNKTPMALTLENYKKGLLVDDQLMAGVTDHPEQPGKVVAFILDHGTGEYLAFHPFEAAEQALAALNGIKRSWKYEATGGCGKGDCAKSGTGACPGGLCGNSAHSKAKGKAQDCCTSEQPDQA